MRAGFRLSPLLVLGSALLALACGGGASVDPADHLEPICSAGVDVPHAVDLAGADVPSAVVSEGVTVVLGEELRFGNDAHVVTLAELAIEMQVTADMTKALGKAPHDVMLHIGVGTPLAQVQEVAEVLVNNSAGPIRMVVTSPEPWPRPTYPDPATADSFKELMAEASPDMRMMLAAREIESMIVACPGAQRAFAAVASASTDQRCVLMAYGLKEALPSCPLTDGDAVVTAFQVLAEQKSERRPGVLKAILSPTGTPVPVPTDATWRTIAPLLQKQSGPVWPVDEAA